MLSGFRKIEFGFYICYPLIVDVDGAGLDQPLGFGDRWGQVSDASSLSAVRGSGLRHLLRFDIRGTSFSEYTAELLARASAAARRGSA